MEILYPAMKTWEIHLLLLDQITILLILKRLTTILIKNPYQVIADTNTSDGPWKSSRKRYKKQNGKRTDLSMVLRLSGYLKIFYSGRLAVTAFLLFNPNILLVRTGVDVW